MENQSKINQWDEETIDLGEIYFLFRQKIKQMIAVFLIGAVIAGVFTAFFITPIYKATASLYVVSASNDSIVNLSDLQIGTSLTADYEILLKSRPMMESVIQNLSLEDETVGSLNQQISISNPSGTRILQITVENEDPELAAKIANEVANLGITWLPAVMGSAEPNIAEDAVVPLNPSSPSLIKNILIGAVAALAVYCGFVLIRYMMNDTIRSSEEFERYFGIVPLAVVPECSSDEDDDLDSENVPSLKQKKKKGA